MLRKHRGGVKFSQDKETRLQRLEEDLLAGVRAPKVEVPIEEIRHKGLLAALQERATQMRRPR